jgi:hypothetical protein
MRAIKIQGIHFKLHKCKHYITLKALPAFYWYLEQSYKKPCSSIALEQGLLGVNDKAQSFQSYLK